MGRAKPIYREFIHWIAIVTFKADGTQDTVEQKLGYVGPAPPCSSGLHRYAFILFEYPASADLDVLYTELKDRGGKKACVAAKSAGYVYTCICVCVCV